MAVLAVAVVVMALVPSAGSAIGAGEVEGRLYTLPEAGTYELPVIDRVARHQLIDTAGRLSPILANEPGGCSVVSFVYSACSDANGCPLVLSTLRRVDTAISANTTFANRVRLVTVSFDPDRDTPDRLQMLRSHLGASNDWRFLTAGSEAALRPVLDDYGQDALRLVSIDSNEWTPLIRHVAKVFLVDSDGGIRNVYSSGFLDHEILFRDIETLLLEQEASTGRNPNGLEIDGKASQTRAR